MTARTRAGAPYLPALDGLRAAAVTGVLLYHGGVTWMRGGYLGVDAFFVLSGFLITGLLLGEWRADGTIRFAAFWARRARRLLPALMLVLVAVAAYAAWLAPLDQLDRLRADALSTFGYIANWHFIGSGQGYFDQFGAPSPLRHAWSLAIEEQFYLVWPLLTFAWLRWRQGSTRGLTAACLTLAGASALAMGVLFTPGEDASRVYYGTDTRAQAILIGAALAVVVHRRGVARSPRLRRAIGIVALAGAAVSAWMWVTVRDSETWMYRGGYLLAAASVAAVIASIARPDPGLLGRVLSFAPVRWVGRVSYGVYLWHWPVYVVFVRERVGLDGTALLLVRLAITFTLATASYYLVELPIRNGALRRRRAWVIAPAASAVVVALLVVSTLGGRPAPADVVAVARADPPVEATVPALAGESVLTRVLVVGDSIALSLAEGIRTDFAANGITVLDEGALGCGIITTGKVWIAGELPTISPKCADWPERWSRATAEFVPDVTLVLVGAWDAFDREIDGRWIPFDTPESDALLRADLERAVDLLSAGGAHVVLLTVPYYEYRYSVVVPDVSRSAFVPERVDHFNEILEGLAADDERITLLDLNHFLSPDGEIHATINGIVVQGDGVHFSPEGGQYVAGWLRPKLTRLAASP